MDFKEAHFGLFAAMADAVEALEKQNFGDARNILIEAQQKWEEQYMVGDS